MGYYNDRRKNLMDMIADLDESGLGLKDLYYTVTDDKKTTVFDSIQGMWDDLFSKEIEREDRAENAYWDKVDEAYERQREERQ